jgi:hypothetical protein
VDNSGGLTARWHACFRPAAGGAAGEGQGRVHLQIKPGLRTAWRAPDAVQIGLEPGRGAVLEGLTAVDRRLVEQLEEGVDEATLPTDGPAGERTRRLLALLRAGDVLLSRRSGRGVLARLGAGAQQLAPDAAVWGVVRPGNGDGWELIADRGRREVDVVGTGRLAAELAQTLISAGVGRVRELPVPPPSWPLPGQGAATGVGRRGPDVVVLVRVAAADSVAAEHLLAADVPHLSVVVREAGLVVGPLVLPGEGPCLRCLDLHRTDRDPAWPRLLAQLPGRATAADAGETTSSRLGAALAALQVLGHLDGNASTAEGTRAGRASGTGGTGRPATGAAASARPASVGATLEVDLPDGLVSRRAWTVHPACGCSWPAAAPAPAAAGPA